MSEWKTVRLGDVCEKGSSNIAQNEIADNNGEYPIYGAAGFIKNVDFYKQDKPYIGIVKDGAGVGRVSVHPAKSSLIGTMQYIFPKENIDIKFLAEFLKYQNLSRFYTGATIPHIYFKDYQNIPLKLPSLQKQKHISAVLGKCAELTVKNKRILEKYDTLIKSRFIEMFGDPILNSKGYNYKKLEELGKWESGGTPSRKNSDYFKGTIPWYSAGELNSLYLYDSNEKITENAIKESSAKLFRKGSLFVGMYDTAAFKMGIATSDCSSNQACANILPNKEVNVLWLYYILLEMKEFFLQNRRGVRQKNLNLGMIKGFEIPYATIDLQNNFAAFVQQIDKSKFAVQKSLEKMETLYKSLMQLYFA